VDAVGVEYRDSNGAGASPAQRPAFLVASRGCDWIDAGGVGRLRADPDRAPGDDVVFRPALAEIMGDGRPWTVSMISALSVPWR